MATLVVIQGADRGKRFDLTEDLLEIGRDAESAIRLTDTEVSRHHAQLRRTEDQYCLIDLGSSNGSYVNGTRAEEVALKSGDQIQCGQSVLMYRGDTALTSGDIGLADRITVVDAANLPLDRSAIVSSVAGHEGSRLLTSPEKAEGVWLRTALANLSVLYQTTHAISHILDADELLEKIMDLIFEVIDADRGCIMLADETSGGFQPKAARWRTRPAANERIGISRTIMNYVLERREGVLTSNAMRDDRFRAGESILQHGIRSAICVPMEGRQDLVGAIYVDTCVTPADLAEGVTRTGTFTKDHLQLMVAIAHLSAVAVENTRYYQALLRTERLAAVGETIAILSHHIKNILQGIRGGSYLIDLGLTSHDEESMRRGWRVVEKNQTKIYNLVMDMLSFSKERRPVLELTDVNTVVADVVELMMPGAREAGVTLSARLSRDLPQAHLDPEGIHRAVLNIVTNAVEAVHENTGRVTVVTFHTGDQIHIAVRDDGPGIPAEQVGQIFNVFASTKGSRGTGLGLAVAQKIVREHDGDIQVESRPGVGTRFTIALPIDPRQTTDGQDEPDDRPTRFLTPRDDADAPPGAADPPT